MDLFLLSMPIGDMTQPYTAMPVLAGHLRPLGFEVTQKDYGIEFAHYWSEPQRIERLWAVLGEALSATEHGGLSDTGWENYVDLKLLAARLEPHLANARKLLLDLTSRDVIKDLRRLSHRLRFLTAFQHLIEFVERRSMPHFANFQALGRDEAMGAVHGPAPIYREFIEAELARDLVERAPRMVGISVTYPRQLYPSLLACAAVRRYLPETKVVLGGAYLSTVAETFFDRPELLTLWDFIVDGEGETALQLLLEAGGDAGQIGGVPNLIYQSSGGPSRNARRHEEDIHRLNAPDYVGLNVDRYFAPDPVFLLPVARGCYMRCTFCSISYATRKYRSRTGPEIVSDIRTLQAQFGADHARYFNFSIDVMAPKHLKEMAAAIAQAKLPVVWDAEIRFDNTLSRDIITLMKQAGCRHIRFGLESAVDRVRNLMDKRIRMDRVNEILADCRSEDIKTSAMVIVGFPGETEAEARATFQFLYDSFRKIRFFTLHLYTVSRGSIIAADPARFGVELTIRPDRFVQPAWDFKIGEGLSTEHARCLIGEFRSRLMERYPFADEGFSVGIGGAFTFLVTAHWSWNDLMRLDEEAATAPENLAVCGWSVPAIMPRIEMFTSPFAYDGDKLVPSSDDNLYLATPEHTLLRLEGTAKAVIGHIDGQQSVHEIAANVFGDDSEDTIRELTEFLVTLRSSGAVRFLPPNKKRAVGEGRRKLSPALTLPPG